MCVSMCVYCCGTRNETQGFLGTLCMPGKHATTKQTPRPIGNIFISLFYSDLLRIYMQNQFK